MFVRAICFVLLYASISSCTHEKHEEEKLTTAEEYVIRSITEDYIRKKLADGESIMLGVEFYGDYNIILIDSLSNVYYHKKRFVCQTPPEEINIFPLFRFLLPDNFEYGKHTDIVLNKILADPERSTTIYIAHNRDTIRDERYFQLKNAFKSNNITFITRLLTEEEEAVLRSKLNKKEYKPEELEWKRTRSVPGKDF